MMANIFNKKEAAGYLKISVECLDANKDRGKLTYAKIGKRVVFRQIDLDKFLERLLVPAIDTGGVKE
jgi:excisionase family DNA binding protein